jgi:hypothetical protein
VEGPRSRKHGGRRVGAGRPPGRLEDSLALYKAVEEFRTSEGRSLSVSRACALIAKRRWINAVGKVVTVKSAQALRNKHAEAARYVTQFVPYLRSWGDVTLAGLMLLGSRPTPKLRECRQAYEAAARDCDFSLIVPGGRIIIERKLFAGFPVRRRRKL